MLKAQKSSTRLRALMPLTGMCCAVALITSGSALAADGDGGRRCPGLISEAGDDPSAFPQPHVRRSSHGQLRTMLHACIGTNQVLDENAQPPEPKVIHTPTFDGTIPGPTLSVEPGDKLSILLFNDLPPNPPNERDNFFPHEENTINIHTHGLTVSPLGMSDNIFRRMEPGTVHKVEVNIPKDHPAGTFWYHTHRHGSVSYQFFGGMAGFLIVRGGPGTLDAVPEVAAAKDIVMGFQVIRTTADGTLAFVHEQAEVFGTFPGATSPELQGLWSTYGIDGGPPLGPDGTPGQPSAYSYTTNGVANPTLHMRPGEVQRWRLLNATDGDNLLLTVVSPDDSQQGLPLNIVAMDGITVKKIYTLNPGDPVVMGSGQRADVMVKAGKPGTYLLQALDPNIKASVSPFRAAQFPNGIDPESRASRHSFDFPTPCPNLGDLSTGCPEKKFKYPVPLATVIVDDGPPLDMALPADPLPAPEGLPSIATMLRKVPDVVRHVAFEICGDLAGTSQDPTLRPATLLPSCGWYFMKYDAAYWGGAPFYNLEMMRDADDAGVPTGDAAMPLVNFKKEGLFDPNDPLFPDMIAGNYEEWTVYNRSFSDHPFHIHQNHVLVTRINGITLPVPEWHDTLVVPGAIVPNVTLPGAIQNGQPIFPLPPIVNINQANFGSITFRTYLNPVTAGCFVMHCHILNHEDIGMMQRVDVLPAPGQSSGCVPESMNHASLRDRLFADRGNFQICSAAVRQSKPISNVPAPPAN
jgi:FtsP/CotA-like multicopper oxidase with cupredoxin domain